MKGPLLYINTLNLYKTTLFASSYVLITKRIESHPLGQQCIYLLYHVVRLSFTPASYYEYLTLPLLKIKLFHGLRTVLLLSIAIMKCQHTLLYEYLLLFVSWDYIQ